jgi:hypothetical protein
MNSLITDNINTKMAEVTTGIKAIVINIFSHAENMPFVGVHKMNKIKIGPSAKATAIHLIEAPPQNSPEYQPHALVH